MSKNDVLSRLAANIKARRTARPEDSHTRRLLDGAPVKPAKKLGEEAVETAIAALAQDDDALIAEAADLLYHLLVVLESLSTRSWPSSSGEWAPPSSRNRGEKRRRSDVRQRT
jgi:phosphoribosyl-ATP pyrophosphohydrolase